MSETRNKRMYQELFGGGCGTVLVTTPENIYYTVGFSTTARRPAQIGLQCVVMTPEHTCFLFPVPWKPLVEEQVDAACAELVPYQGKQQLVEKICERIGTVDMVGFERGGMELELYLSLQERLAAASRTVTWQDVTPFFQQARLRKHPEEIAALRASARVAKAAMEHAKTLLVPGVTELEVVAELEYFMRKSGSDGVPFTMKVLAGEHAARTVNLPGKRVIQEGDLVLLDFGAVVEHYASDWTRSFVVGRASARQQELYDLVWKVERTCIRRIRPGVSMSELMDCAWQVLEGYPLAQWFNPYLGHSIGISSQEYPAIVAGEQTVLQENMVITIEPGIYVPGLGGVRIEDEVLVTADGHEILTGLEQEGVSLW